MRCACDYISLTILHPQQLPPAVIRIFYDYMIPVRRQLRKSQDVSLCVFQVLIVVSVIRKSRDASGFIIEEVKCIAASASCVLHEDLPVRCKVFCCDAVYRLLGSELLHRLVHLAFLRYVYQPKRKCRLHMTDHKQHTCVNIQQLYAYQTNYSEKHLFYIIPDHTSKSENDNSSASNKFTF